MSDSWTHEQRAVLMKDTYGNGNLRDRSDPKGARHASDRGVAPNTHAVHDLKGRDYSGKHREK